MSLNELLPSLKELNHAEKLLAVQFLVNEMAMEENLYFRDGAEYPIWSPYDSFGASEKLLEMLKMEEKNA